MTVQGEKADPEITIKLKHAYIDRPETIKLVGWIRWLILRDMAGLPVNLNDARRIAKNWRYEYNTNEKIGNRKNVPQAPLSLNKGLAKDALENAKKWEGVVDELEDGPPTPEVANPAPFRQVGLRTLHHRGMA